MKKKKILIYLLSGLMPLLIFFICAQINGYLPFGKEILNAYDSFTQYPGILLEYKNLLNHGNIFYSFNAGLGFNFFGTLTYYTMSPLNLFCLFANPLNYPHLIAFMTYLRIFLLGLSMCFYLNSKNTKPLYTVLFSTCFGLMGFIASYYYNYLWIDSIIMTPLIIYGLDKLIDEGKPKFYLISLALTILINYYIGYMICIFCLIYFIYRLVETKNKKETIKRFITSSILAGLIGTVVILPSFFALMTGKSSLYSRVDYSGFTRNIFTFFYSFFTGTFQNGDQSYGPAQVYSSILVLVLTFYYFFSSKHTKKQKITMFLILSFFYLSCSMRFLNYSWQFFQKPIWWQSRFSFVISFFLIITASDTLSNIDSVKFKTKYKLILSILFLIAVMVGVYFKWQIVADVELYTYFFLFLSVMLFLEMMFTLDKKKFLPLIIVFTVVDLFINTYNSLKNNYRYNNVLNFTMLRRDLPNQLEKLNKENDSFYRFEFIDDYTSNDGMYFNYHGINYFNSVRNIKPLELLESLGMFLSDKCHLRLKPIDPVILSLFNIKYLYGNIDFLKRVDNKIYENPYPLSIGFLSSSKIKDTKLTSEIPKENVSIMLDSIVGEKTDIYKKIDITEFDLKNCKISDDGKEILRIKDYKDSKANYKFTSKKDYLIFISDKMIRYLKVNDKLLDVNKDFNILKPGDKVEVSFNLGNKHFVKDANFFLLDISKYEDVMKKLSTNIMKARTYKNGHILEGSIDVKEDNSYLFTSIEYEEGMKVYVDGVRIKPDILLNSLIGFDINKGHHEIFIDYIPKGLKLGAIVTITSVVVSGIYLQRNKKNL